MIKAFIVFLIMGSSSFGQMINYHSIEDEKVMGYLSKPKSKGPFPGIILIHEWWGLNQDIKNKADEFAKKGYIALAVDLYRGNNTSEPNIARKLAGNVRGNIDEAFKNLKSGLDYLKKINEVDPQKLAAIGWCFGGGWSYQIAKNNLGVKASVIYYGRFNPDDDLSIMRSNIIGHFAENDRGISIDNVKEFQAKLKTHKGYHEIYIYPNTMHGFASRPGENSIYNKNASDKAWKRTISFLDKTLN